MRREGNIFALSKKITKFLTENPGKNAFLAEQPNEDELTASYRAFSRRPDLGRGNDHADCYRNREIMIGFAGNFSRGLGADLAEEISTGFCKRERYGIDGRNILYLIELK